MRVIGPASEVLVLVLSLLVPSAGAVAPGCDPAAAVAGVVVNEVLANPVSTDADREWVELVNGSGRAADLSGWVLAAGTSSLEPADPLPAGTVLPAGAWLVVGGPDAPEATIVVGGLSLGNASSSADAVQLRDCEGGVADTVVYGAPNTDGWVGDGGDPTQAPTPPEGATLGRLPDGHDTDEAAADLVVLPYATPGRANDAAPDTCGGPGSGIVVNELLPDPEGGDEGSEWVEILHTGARPVDLEGWTLQAGTTSLAVRYTWPAGRLRPGERLLLGGASVPGADVVVDGLSLGNATSSSDAVAIVDCRGFAADTVVYGGPNDDGFLDDAGEVATRLAPAPGEGQALQRAADGVDTDDDASDWVVTDTPTPGEPNQEPEPVACVPSDGAVRLNEVLPDPEGADDGLEWVELFNRSPSRVVVGGWGLSFGTSDFDATDVVLPAEAAIPAHGFLVVGGQRVDEADVVASFSIGNGTETDGVRLLDCESTPVDTVLYGEAPDLDLLPDDLGEIVDPYGDPGSDEAIARLADGVDSDAAADWKVVGRPTPGETNVRDPGELADEPVVRRGCEQDAGGPEPLDPGGCATSPRTAPILASLALAALLRRRTARADQALAIGSTRSGR